MIASHFEAFVPRSFRPASEALIALAAEIIQEYGAQGYTLTLRQIYYQFISRDVLPNTERSYKALGSLVTDARMAGLLPWDGIEDRGRGRREWLVQENVGAILDDIPAAYAVDLWAEQPSYIECWIEKDALSNVVARACSQVRVPYLACRGYLSASEAWRAGQRFREAVERGKAPVIIHLGDHDPSGLDMTRDNAERVSLFARAPVSVERVALNRDQVRRYDPPPNPTKLTDARAEGYLREHGTTCWELDALEPSVVVDLIRRAVLEHVDHEAWAEALTREHTQKERLTALKDGWLAEALLEGREGQP